MVHLNYFIVEASDNYQLGLKLGEMFGEQAQGVIEKRKKEHDWYLKIEKAELCLVATKEYFPRYVREIEGYAVGANVEFLNLWAVSLENDLNTLDHCTTVITNAGKIIMHNEDWDAGAENQICVLKKTVGTLTVLELFYYNTLGGNAISINSNGFVSSVNSLTHSDRGRGVSRNAISRWLSEINDLKYLNPLHYVKTCGGDNYNIVHGKNFSVWNLENSATSVALREINPPFVHTNHHLSSLECFEANDNSTETHERYDLALEKVRPLMTVPEMIELSNSKKPNGEDCIMNERTIAKMIVNLENQTANIWLKREVEKGWLSYNLDFIR